MGLQAGAGCLSALDLRNSDSGSRPFVAGVVKLTAPITGQDGLRADLAAVAGIARHTRRTSNPIGSPRLAGAWLFRRASFAAQPLDRTAPRLVRYGLGRTPSVPTSRPRVQCRRILSPAPKIFPCRSTGQMSVRTRRGWLPMV